MEKKHHMVKKFIRKKMAQKGEGKERKEIPRDIQGRELLAPGGKGKKKVEGIFNQSKQRKSPR